MTKQEYICICKKSKEAGDIYAFYVGHDCIYTQPTEDSEFYPSWPEPEWSAEFEL